jgi:hypothetical protein
VAVPLKYLILRVIVPLEYLALREVVQLEYPVLRGGSLMSGLPAVS